MNKLIAAIKRAPKRAAGFAAIAAAVIVPAALFAWGPDRPTFTMANPAPYVTFNSITDNSVHGDERNFVQIKEANAPASSYGENVNLQAGKEYMVYVFYHNNAASNLNDAAHNYKGVAKDAAMRVSMPATVKAGENARFTGYVGASNAQPQQVWDEAYGKAESNFALRYVPGSATIHSNGAVDGKTLPDSLYTTGTPLGYDALDGKLPGCNQYAGYVTFKFKVDQPKFEVEKTVSKNGTNAYAETVEAKASDKVDFKIKYKNTGTMQQDNVIIKDKLPAGLTYVKGSTSYSNANTGNTWKTTTNDAVVERGLNLGSYAPGGAVYVKFTAQVTDASKLEKCGINTLTNTATAETANGSKSDTANVTVKKDCEQPAEYSCDSLSGKKISRLEYQFDGSASANNGAEIVSYTFDFGDGTTKTVESPKNVRHTYKDEPGTKTITMSATVKVKGSEKTVTSEACKVTITVNKVDECKPGIPTGDKRCEETPATPEKPETPKELPKTGMDSAAAVIGLGSIIAATSYYVASRRALNQ